MGLKDLLLELSSEKRFLSFTDEKVDLLEREVFLEQILKLEIEEKGGKPKKIAGSFWEYFQKKGKSDLYFGLTKMSSEIHLRMGSRYRMIPPFYSTFVPGIFDEKHFDEFFSETRNEQIIKINQSLINYEKDIESYKNQIGWACCEEHKSSFEAKKNSAAFNSQELELEKDFLLTFYKNLINAGRDIRIFGFEDKIKSEVKSFCEIYPEDKLLEVKNQLKERVENKTEIFK